MDIGRFYEASNKGEFDQKCVRVRGRAMLMSARSSIIAIKIWNQKQKQIKM
jgi:hypothetical protein